MIEITNNKVRCHIREPSEEVEKDEEQERKYKEVIAAYVYAHELFKEYQKEYGTDLRGIAKILNYLNGGKI